MLYVALNAETLTMTTLTNQKDGSCGSHSSTAGTLLLHSLHAIVVAAAQVACLVIDIFSHGQQTVLGLVSAIALNSAQLIG